MATADFPPDNAALLPGTWQRLHKLADYRRDLARQRGLPVAELFTPAFAYQDLPASARLTYELVGWLNVDAYLPLFAPDPSPFVDARFKSRAALEDYAVTLLVELRTSWKRGAADWLVRRRADGQPLGVLHLYDLSRELVGSWRPHCAVGYAVVAAHRRQGYGYEALTHLLTQAHALFGQTTARAIVAASNLASQALLRKCGFAILEERPATRYAGAEALWQRQLPDAGCKPA